MLNIPNFLYSCFPVNIEVPITPIVKAKVSRHKSNLLNKIPRIKDIPAHKIKVKNVKEEVIGIFLLIKTTRLFPEPKRAIVDDTAAIPIKKANSPNFEGSKTLATKNQKAIPIAVPPISPIPIENKPVIRREFFIVIQKSKILHIKQFLIIYN